jgi:hypothetical protein
MYRVSSVVFLACLTLATVCSSALAQPASGGATPPGYDQAIDTALQEFEAGNFAEARSQFLKAHGIFPNARTLRALGKSEYELKNYAEAAVYLEQALESRVRPLTNEQRQETQHLLGSSRGYLGRYMVSLRPANARMLLDGSPIPKPESGVLVLKVGDHTVEARADGYASESRRLRVVGGGSESLIFDLKLMNPEPAPTPVAAAPLPEVALPATDAAPPPAAPVQKDETPLRRKWWLWTGVAAVVAGGAVAAVLLTMKKPAQDEPSGGSLGIDLPVPSSAATK